VFHDELELAMLLLARMVFVVPVFLPIKPIIHYNNPRVGPIAP